VAQVIVASMGLVLLAVVLLVTGTTQVSDPMLYGSIAASAGAAAALVVGVRQLGRAGLRAAVVRPVAPHQVRAKAPTGTAGSDHELNEADDVPVDEPPAEPVHADQVAALRRVVAVVLVVDTRPRFHRPDCLHLLGRAAAQLTVADAIEYGFSPCALCRAATTLLGDS
jgi:hypothetical protein